MYIARERTILLNAQQSAQADYRKLVGVLGPEGIDEQTRRIVKRAQLIASELSSIAGAEGGGQRRAWRRMTNNRCVSA